MTPANDIIIIRALDRGGTYGRKNNEKEKQQGDEKREMCVKTYRADFISGGGRNEKGIGGVIFE